EAPKPGSSTPTRLGRDSRGTGATTNRQEQADASPSTAHARDAVADKEYTHVMGRGEVLSDVIRAFNTEAKAKGYQVLTSQQVMKYNNITDPRRIKEGAKILL